MSWLALPLILLLPGYLTLAAWQGARDLDFWEGLFLAPFISILLSSWLGLVLAELGLFSLLNLSLALVFCCVILGLGAKGHLRPACLAAPSLPPEGLAFPGLLAVLALAGWAFSRPAEVVSGTFDPGVYLSTGASIAHTGSIAYSDPFLAGLEDSLRPFLLERRGETGVGAVRLPAFWMPQAQGDTVIPAFFHLYPLWLAILYSIGGIQAALFVSPIFGVMGVWALFLLGRRLAGPGVALLAAALLALNPAQVWFARYPISEITVQMLLLGGLALWVLMEDQRSRFLALLAGTSLGLVHLAKIDQIFLPAALFLAFFLLWAVGGLERRHWFLIVPYGLLLIHSLLHMYFFAFAYTWVNLSPFLPALTSRIALSLYAGAALALLAAGLARGRWGSFPWKDGLAHRVQLSLALAGTVAVAAPYAYFIWPLNADPTPTPFLSSDGITPVYLNLFREEGLVRLGWYLSPLGLALGLGGFVLFLGTKADRRSWPLLLLFVAQLVFYLLTAGLAYPLHFWASRRYLPLVIPAFLLFASLALVGQRPSRWLGHWPTTLVAAALAFALLATSVQASAGFLWQTEYQGALAGLGRWAGQMRDPALVFFLPRLEGNIFSAPLQHLYGKTAFVLQQEPEEPFLSQGIQAWLAEGRNVYLVLADRYPQYLSGNLDYGLVDSAGLEFRAMEQSADHLPREALAMSFPLRLYQLRPRAGYPYRQEMGPLPTGNTLRLGLPPSAASALRLSFRAWAGGPLLLRKDRGLTLSLDDLWEQGLMVGEGPQSYQFIMPIEEARRGGSHQLTLTLEPAPGAEAGGIVLEWFEVREATGP